jgi:hypothetical protein
MNLQVIAFSEYTKDNSNAAARQFKEWMNSIGESIEILDIKMTSCQDNLRFDGYDIVIRDSILVTYRMLNDR